MFNEHLTLQGGVQKTRLWWVGMTLSSLFGGVQDAIFTLHEVDESFAWRLQIWRSCSAARWPHLQRSRGWSWKLIYLRQPNSVLPEILEDAPGKSPPPPGWPRLSSSERPFCVCVLLHGPRFQTPIRVSGPEANEPHKRFEDGPVKREGPPLFVGEVSPHCQFIPGVARWSARAPP